MQFRKKIAIPLVACSMGLVAAVGGNSLPASAAVSGGPVLALTTTNTLLGFDATAPSVITQTTTITGLQAGETIVGVDVRPATGEMFAVGVAGTTGRMYVINTATGAATLVGAGPFSTTLPTGGTWSVDFNPSVDRIRFVHSTGVNLRLNPLNGTLAATDTPIAPGKATALAYDRSVSPAPAATTLFGIDDVAKTLIRVGGVNGTPSPNLGATETVGPLGALVSSSSVGFDIAPQGDALATFSLGGIYSLYTVNLTTGASSLVGNVGGGNVEIRDIALPRPPVGAMLGLGLNNALLKFDASNPAAVTTTTITGLQPGETIEGFDIRPATGELIGVGFVGTAGRIYRIDAASGVATQIGTAPFAVAATATGWSVDFNPTVDRIRLVSSAGASYRINPVNGALAANDTAVAPAKPSAVAYDRSVATAAATTLYAIDDVADTLNRIGGPDGLPSPNGGATTLVGPLGVNVDLDNAALDISPLGQAVAALGVGNVTRLYTINLATGAASVVGPIGDGTPVVFDVAFAPTTVAGASQFTAVTATRVLDTRQGGGAKPAAGATVDVQITGANGVPTNATAVVLNVTGTEATVPGFVTVYPTGEAMPTVSNQNLIAGQTRANLATVKLGAGGKVSIFTANGTHLVADLLGYYAPATSSAGRFTALTPARLVDTRQGGNKLAVGGTVSVPVLGKQGVPTAGVSSVLVNIAGTEANLPGYLTAYASGTTQPSTSNVNLERVGSTASNLAIVPVGADGSITVFSNAGAHVIVDIAGWYSDATAKGGTQGLYVPVSPTRVLDTRAPLGVPTAGALPINGSIDLTLAGVGGVPAFGASSAIINVTSDASLQAGFVTVYPTGSPLTAVSSLNVDVAGQPTPNLVGATLGTGGKVTLLAQAGGHLIADVGGWFIA